MDTSTALQTARELLTPWAKEFKTPEPNRLDAMITATDLLPAVQALRNATWGYLTAITGIDLMGRTAQLAQDERWKAALATAPGVDVASSTGALEVLYHFCQGGAIVTLRTLTVREAAAVPSICSIIPAANFFERELREMFGVTVTDTPNPTRLYLSDDWPADTYPLRKDFTVTKT